MLSQREKLIKTLNHEDTNDITVDIGGAFVTGMHVSIVYKLRQYYQMDKPGEPVKVVEPYQMLGEIGDDLKKLIGCDIATPESDITAFGYPNSGFKEWKLNDGTPILVPELFNTKKNQDGSIYQYPMGDKSFSPSGIMSKKGFFFNAIIRKKGVGDDNLNPKDNVEEYKLLSKADLHSLYKKVKNIYENTNYGIIIRLPGTSFGDIYTIPGIALKDPKGIRDIEEWYISLCNRKEYIKDMFTAQLETGLENLEQITKKLSGMVQVIAVSGTDFGTQNGLFISKNFYRELFKPYHKAINDFIHQNTNWKTFIHTCGAIYDLIPDLIEAGFDILNPVQISAKGMDPKKLKSEYGKYITFWGGGVNTQKILPFSTPEEVKEEVKKNIDVFNNNGGFVFSTVHNIQGNVPVENVVAMIETLKEFQC